MFSVSCRATTAVSRAIQRSNPACLCVLAACPSRLLAKEWGSRRTYSSSGSIFNGSDSWDQILAELDKPKSHSTVPITTTPLKRHRAPRQSITKRETKLLSDMLNRILDNKPDQEDGLHLGLGGGKLQDLFGQLRQHRPTMRNTDESTVQELLDVKKEQMSLCENDLQLLEWAQKNVFGESITFEETAKKAMKDAQEGKVTQLPILQPPTYPHMIAALMKTFRERYRDPHLALAIFNHAQNLSIVSYVFGCSTDAYNELLETRWTCFHDMQGVLDALEEMQVNAVPINSKTRIIVDRMRTDFGQSKGPVASNRWELLQRIEQTMAVQGQKVPWDAWKNEVWDEDSAFDSWEFSDSKKPARSKKAWSR